MREIKFRAWHKKKKKWYDLPIKIFTLGYSNEMALCETFGYDGNTEGTDNSYYKNDSPEDYELMQYTGLKDKNNKEIYEGDIVKIEGLQDVQEVEWDKRFYCWRFKQSDNMLDIGGDKKVKGNIYENPELLSPRDKK